MTEYAKPSLTADVAVFAIDESWRLRALFIRRGKEPFKGSFAFPGGFVEEGEDTATAAARELEEETGLSHCTLEQVGAFSEPGRDPRGWVVSVAYVSALRWDEAQAAKGADDAAEARWLEIAPRADGKADALDGGEKVTLAFDHEEVLAWALARLQQRVAFWVLHRMIQSPFVLENALRGFESVLHRPLDPLRFRDALQSRGAIAEVNGAFEPRWPSDESWG